MSQGDALMAAKAANQADPTRLQEKRNTGGRDDSYYLYDNDPDNFDPTLSSQSAEYVRNVSSSFSEDMMHNRHATGGGIEYKIFRAGHATHGLAIR